MVRLPTSPYWIDAVDVEREGPNLDAFWNRTYEGTEAKRAELYARDPNCARVWALRTKDGTLVGATGHVERTLKIGTEQCLARWQINFAVDPAHRNGASVVTLARTLTNSRGSGGEAPLLLGATRTIGAVLGRLGLGVLGRIERWVKPLAAEPILQTRVRYAAIRKPAAALLGAYLRLTAPERRAPRHGMRSELASGFDARFDELWERAARHFEIASVRDRAALAWRFPGAKVVCLFDRSGALAGYGVYCLWEGIAVIEDLLWVDDAALDPLLIEVLRYLRRENVRAVRMNYFGARTLPERLRHFGFRPSLTAKQVFMLARPPFDAKLAHLLDRQHWHLTAADLDL